MTCNKRWSILPAWVAFAIITVIYFFGLAATQAIDFGPPRSIISVIREISFKDLRSPYLSPPSHLGLLGGCTGALIVYTFCGLKAVRVGLAIACIMMPLVLLPGGGKGIALWVISMPFAPFWSLSAIIGYEDGEFYSEGFPMLVAGGWWMILWSWLLISTLRRNRHGMDIPSNI